MDRAGHHAPPAVLAATGAAGLVAATVLPADRPGIGWLVAALFAVAAVITTARRVETVARKRNLGWAVLAVALVAVGAFRDARWLFTLCALTALLAASLAVAGGRSTVEIVRGALEVPANAVRRLGWLTGGVRAIRPHGNTRTLATVVVSLALLVLFGALFVQADATFAAFASSLVPTVDGVSTFTSSALFIVMSALVSGAFWVLTRPRPDFSLELPRIRLRRIEWLMPISVLVVLFAVFSYFQLPVLFGLVGDVPVTTGLSYAEYARRGFWQLLAVTVLTLGIIAVVSRLAPRDDVADRTWLRALLGSLSVLSLVVVAAAVARMWLYQQEFGFTVLRLLVMTCELWLGLVYLLVLAAGVRLRGTWLPGTVVATAMVTLLLLAVLNPERMIADGNITRWERTGKIDMGYLYPMSADAVPALTRMPEPRRACMLSWITNKLADNPDDWREWNLARSTARAVLVRRPTPCLGVVMQRN
ncbi:DUF4153 domain-containing protein [Allokutzneria oryzae]|uniref:DUF4153 domain-containing protein n=1 Tax=Allokutzneria oryzae TaxID=1378989 RepID=A0ABV6A6M2_9PSEU